MTTDYEKECGKEKLPFDRKMVLTIREAAEYSNIAADYILRIIESYAIILNCVELLFRLMSEKSSFSTMEQSNRQRVRQG